MKKTTIFTMKELKKLKKKLHVLVFHTDVSKANDIE